MTSRIVYRSRWITLREDQVIRPNGERGTYGFIQLRLTAGVLAIDSRNHIALIEEFRYPLKTTTYELPRGLSVPGETPLQAAQREASEEAGIVGGRWQKLGVLNPGPGFTNEYLHLFLVRGFRVEETHPDDVEVQRVHWVPFPTLRKWIHKGKCNDAMTLAAIARYDTLAKKQRAG